MYQWLALYTSIKQNTLASIAKSWKYGVRESQTLIRQVYQPYRPNSLQQAFAKPDNFKQYV